MNESFNLACLTLFNRRIRNPPCFSEHSISSLTQSRMTEQSSYSRPPGSNLALERVSGARNYDPRHTPQTVARPERLNV